MRSSYALKYAVEREFLKEEKRTKNLKLWEKLVNINENRYRIKVIHTI